MASIKDVARKAGVGSSTVSRVISQTGYVSEGTRDKVLMAMKELNYTPSEIARNFVLKKTGIIAVLVPDIAHPFFSELVKSIEFELYKLGYKTMICNTEKEKNYETEYLEMLKRNVVDGIITGVHSLDIEEYLRIEKPIVAFDRYLGDKIPVVRVDHKLGGHLAAQKLIDSGCKKVLQFQHSLAVKSPSHERHSAFESTMHKHNITTYTYPLDWNKFSKSYFKEAVDNAFLEYYDIDGVFGTDLLAVFSLQKALELGKKVPKDLKIVAYDGTYITKLCYPQITAIVQPVNLLAQEAVALIIKMISQKSYNKKDIMLKVTIENRETTF